MKKGRKLNFKKEPGTAINVRSSCNNETGECDNCGYGTRMINGTNWCCEKKKANYQNGYIKSKCKTPGLKWLQQTLRPVILKTSALKTELCLKSSHLNLKKEDNNALQEYHFYPTSSLTDFQNHQVKDLFCANQGEMCDCVGTIRYITKNSSTINDNTFATNTNNTFFLTQTLEPVLCDHSIGKYGSCICQPLPKEWNQQVAQVNIQFTESGALYFRHGLEPIDGSNTMKYDLLSTMSSNEINLTRTDLARQLELFNLFRIYR